LNMCVISLFGLAAFLGELESLRVKLETISRTNESLVSEKQVLASEKAEWMEERKALVARIHYLTTLLSGQISAKEQSPPCGNQAANTALDPSTTWVSPSGWHQRSITIVL
jgi:hypothetical protein